MGLSPKSQHSCNPGVPPPPAAISGQVPPNTRDPQIPGDKDTRPLLSPLPDTSYLLPFAALQAPHAKSSLQRHRGVGGETPARGTPPDPPHRASAEPGGRRGCAYLHPTGSWIADGTRGTHRALGTESQQKRDPPLGKRTLSPHPGHEAGGSAPYLEAFLSGWPFSAGVTLQGRTRHEVRAGTVTLPCGPRSAGNRSDPTAPRQYSPGVRRPQPHPVFPASPAGPGREEDVWGCRGTGVTPAAPHHLLRAGAAPDPPHPR